MSLPIHFTAHHVDASDALKDLTTKKFERLVKHFDNILKIDVSFHAEHHLHLVKSNVHIPGNTVHATAKAEDMYHAIDDLMHKLERQLDKVTHSD